MRGSGCRSGILSLGLTDRASCSRWSGCGCDCDGDGWPGSCGVDEARDGARTTVGRHGHGGDGSTHRSCNWRSSSGLRDRGILSYSGARCCRSLFRLDWIYRARRSCGCGCNGVLGSRRTDEACDGAGGREDGTDQGGPVNNRRDCSNNYCGIGEACCSRVNIEFGASICGGCGVCGGSGNGGRGCTTCHCGVDEARDGARGQGDGLVYV